MKMRLIENYFSDLKYAFYAKPSELIKTGLSHKLISEFIAWRPSFSLETALAELAKENIKFLTWHDPGYPPLLLQIPDPPFLIYYRGQIRPLAKRLAVVGSREHSPTAKPIIEKLLLPIIAEKIEIISGLAIGIDALAHQTTLKHSGITLAVLGSGLSQKAIYPPINKSLAKTIINNDGALISEFPPNMPPFQQNFPRRNRIISGLASATLIIESREKSGALITAHSALDQNREVLAVPGNILSEFSEGPNKLLSEGAKLVREVRDILEIMV